MLCKKCHLCFEFRILHATVEMWLEEVIVHVFIIVFPVAFPCRGEQPTWPLWENYIRVTLLPWEAGLA